MSMYDFIIDGIRFSYSSLTTFERCPYSFKLIYLEPKPRLDNFYSDYGKFAHDCMEKFFRKELDSFELSDYYRENYEKKVVTYPPPMQYQLYEKYREQGQLFFDNFSFDLEKYEVISVEDKLDFDIEGVPFTARPDLLLRENLTDKIILYDYKTSIPFKISRYTQNETEDKTKIHGYRKQLHLYAYGVEKIRKLPVDDIVIWFVRDGRMYPLKRDKAETKKTILWLQNIVKDLKNEELFTYNNSSQYFCNNLCNVRESCEYHKM